MARKKRAEKTKKRTWGQWVMRWVWAGIKVGLTVVMLTALVATVYASFILDEVKARFDGGRYTVPSRVYSDGLLIFPGQRLSADQLVRRLQRLGYRARSKGPKAVGEYRRRGRTVNVYLRPVDLPVMTRDAQRIRVTFKGKGAKAIESIVDVNGAPVAIVELEPEELLKVFGHQHQSRSLVAFKDVPDSLKHAILAAEDADFYQHSGVDLGAVARALYINVKAGAVKQGGSTLTQQLAKTFFLSPDRTLLRKAQELVIALVIESNYSKDTIFEIYVNEIYLGQRGSVSVHGFKEAARFYFGKGLARLDAAESATLAAIIRGPNRFSPFKRPEAAKRQRDRVLSAMHTLGYLDDRTLEAAKAKKLQTVPYTPYRRIAPYFFDYVAAQVAAKYPGTDLTQEGLSLYTTLDVGVQAEAERALEAGLAKLEEKKLKREEGQPRLQGAVVVLEPGTGHVVAMVGGRDYAESQFNRATQARRQPGSAFKPFVYLTALDKHGLTDLLSNEPKSYKQTGRRRRWKPKNYDGKSGGNVPLRKALVHSMNIPTVALAHEIGLMPVIDTARALGIETELDPELSLALGAFEVVPLQLSVAYAALAHDGVVPDALAVKAVVGEGDKVLRRQHQKLQSVTTPQRAYMITSVLRDVVRHGTGRSLKRRGIDFPVAGKTGTTNDYRDAWFVGYTPDLVTLVWVGYDDNASMKLAASKVALPIWADLMRNIRWRTSGRWFAPPDGLVEAKVCLDTGQLATDGCPHAIDEVFEDPARVPEDRCREHSTGFGRFLESIGL